MSLFNLRMTVSCDRGTKGWVGAIIVVSAHKWDQRKIVPAPPPEREREPLPVPGHSFVTQQLTQNDRWQ